MKVVMYHYIRNFNKKFRYFNKFLSKKEFANQIRYFEKSKGIVKNLDEYEKNKDKYLLTFDDGLKEQLYAAKLLAKKGLFGIFFIPTIPIIKKKFLDVHKIQILLAILGAKKVLNYIGNNEDYKKAVKKIKKKNVTKFSRAYSFNKDNQENIIFKKNMNYLIDKRTRSNVLDEMFKKFKINEKVKDYYMNISDIKYLKKIGMEIGCHSHSHNILSKMTYINQKKEIINSKKILEKKLNSKINFFCFPYGRKYSYDKNTLKILKDVGFKYSFSVESRDVNKKDLLKKFQLPRYDTNYFKV